MEVIGTAPIPDNVGRGRRRGGPLADIIRNLSHEYATVVKFDDMHELHVTQNELVALGGKILGRGNVHTHRIREDLHVLVWCDKINDQEIN